MRQGWILAIILFYLAILTCEVAMTGGSSFASVGNSAINDQQALLNPGLTGTSNVLVQAWTIITGVTEYLQIWFQLLLLYEPTLFAGSWLWAWWYICFPTDCMMVFCIVLAARGVHSS